MFIGNWYLRPLHAALLFAGCAGLLAFLGLVVGPRLSAQLDALVTSAEAQIEPATSSAGEEALGQVLQVTAAQLPLVGEVPLALSGTVQLQAPGQPDPEPGTSFLYAWHTQPAKELVEYYRMQYQVAGWTVTRPVFDPERGSTVIAVSNDRWKAFLSLTDAPAGQAPVKGILQGTFYPLDSSQGPDLSKVIAPDPADPVAQDATPPAQP